MGKDKKNENKKPKKSKETNLPNPGQTGNDNYPKHNPQNAR